MIKKTRTKGGDDRWTVRWYENGRSGARRRQTFDREKDAIRFETAIRRAQQLGHLASEVIGSEQTFVSFCEEWWEKYATTHLAPGTVKSYAYALDRWIVPYLGRLKLRDVTREAIDTWIAAIVRAGAGPTTTNRCVGILQGILSRAVEWRRLPANPAHGIRRIAHVRDQSIEARSPDSVERIRARVLGQDACLISVLAYEGLRPAEAFALEWRDVLDERGRPRDRIRVARSLSDRQVSPTKSKREREIELFGPVAGELLELYLSRGRPGQRELVFPSADGGYLWRQNWRQRVWLPALAAAGVQAFRPYDLRHTCATLLIYSGRSLVEVAEHMGHGDPGVTAKHYAHALKEARTLRHVPTDQAIRRARSVERRIVRAGKATEPTS